MKKGITCIVILFLLAGLTGCGKAEESQNVPALLEPVGVQLDIARAVKDEIFHVETYNGEIVPYVEELQFVMDGTIEKVNVSLGEWVEEGQVLASLDVEAVKARMEEIREEIEDIKKLGEFADRQTMADIQIAKTEAESMKKHGADNLTIRLKEVDIQNLENQLEQAEERRELEIYEKQREWNALKEKAENHEILAPFAGRVVYFREMDSGDPVQGHTTVFCLADESRVWVETPFLSESIIKGANKILAKIGEEEYELEYLPMEKDEYVTRVLKGEAIGTRFLIDADDSDFLCGQFAAVKIISGYKENVLTIPINALYGESDSRYVYKMSDGKRLRCDVVVGSISSTRAEIVEGLEEGDSVYVKE